jgi:hypothetical protein
MRQRCNNPNHKNYADYGGRGISVSKLWSGPSGFANFYAYVGPRPTGTTINGRALYSLDRFPNNDGNYEPGNVRWATQKQQIANQRGKYYAAVAA